MLGIYDQTKNSHFILTLVVFPLMPCQGKRLSFLLIENMSYRGIVLIILTDITCKLVLMSCDLYNVKYIKALCTQAYLAC